VAKLIYAAIMSLDGYIADEAGKFDWAVPDDEVHTFINDLTRPIGTYLFGRRLYEVMVAWEAIKPHSHVPPYILNYSKIWQAADKIVYSKSLESVSSSKTRIERDFNPKNIQKMKETSERDLSVGGSTLAAQAIQAGLVDECHFFITPIVIGSGKRFLPANVQLKLQLLDECRFGNGMAHLHYSTGK